MWIKNFRWSKRQWGILGILQLISTLTIAGTMGPGCLNNGVTVPCPSRLWAIGIDGLYLRPVFTPSFPIYNLPGFVQQDLNNQWNLGYRLTGSYVFNSGNELNLNWSHVSNATNNIAASIAVNNEILSAHPSSKTSFDQVNLVEGQYAVISARVAAKFFAGLQYASMRTRNAFSYSYVDRIAQESHYIGETFKTNFAGIGPTAGTDFAYALIEGLSLTANASAALTYGVTHSSAQATDQSDLLVAPDTVATIAQSAYTKISNVVPSVETKLGLRYGRPLLRGILSVDGGYQALNYFHPLSEYRVSAENTRKLFFSDFGLYGPYFGIHWLGEV